MARPLALFDAFRRHNRAARRGRLGGWAVVSGALLCLAASAAFLVHALHSTSMISPSLARALLPCIAIYAGVQAGRLVAMRTARPLFRDWLQVLPIPRRAVVGHWRKRGASDGALVWVAGSGVCLVAAHYGDVGMLPGLTSIALLGCAIAGALHVWRPIARDSSGATTQPTARAGSFLRTMDSRRVAWIGLWQLRRGWNRPALLATLFASSIIVALAVGVSVAQGTGLPVALAGLLVAVAIFNKSLDCSILTSPTIRLQPLSPARLAIAAARLPTFLSAIAVAIAIALSVVLSGNATPGEILLQASIVSGSWILLTLTRFAACLRHPGGGLRVEIDYLALLLAAGCLLQLAGAPGAGLAILMLLAVLRRAARALP